MQENKNELNPNLFAKNNRSKHRAINKALWFKDEEH